MSAELAAPAQQLALPPAPTPVFVPDRYQLDVMEVHANNPDFKGFPILRFLRALGEFLPDRPEGHCWEWRGHRYRNEYGCIAAVRNGKRRRWLAHRIAYTFFVGPIPEGMTIDHLCRNRPCCNPEHLEPVPLPVNVQRGAGWIGGRCKRHHKLTPETIYVNAKSGKQQCRLCWDERKKK